MSMSLQIEKNLESNTITVVGSNGNELMEINYNNISLEELSNVICRYDEIRSYTYDGFELIKANKLNSIEAINLLTA